MLLSSYLLSQSTLPLIIANQSSSPNNEKEESLPLPFGANPPHHDSKKVAATILVVIRRNEIPPPSTLFPDEGFPRTLLPPRSRAEDEKTLEGVESVIAFR